jgi:hypothetical protein
MESRRLGWRLGLPWLGPSRMGLGRRRIRRGRSRWRSHRWCGVRSLRALLSYAPAYTYAPTYTVPVYYGYVPTYTLGCGCCCY